MSDSMTDPATSSGAKASDATTNPSVEKGKGKAAEQDTMDEDEDEEESGEEEGEGEPEEADEDNMEEIDLENIVSDRTRGKNIDFAEAAKELPEEDDDEEDDEDFQDDDAMEE